MRGPHNIIRLVRTLATFERTGAINVILAAFDAPPRMRVLVRILGWPARPFGLRGDPELPPVTRALTALGPAYIKFGQILSTRPDVVGADLAEQLTYLQDKLPPFSLDKARATIEHELGAPISTFFSRFCEPVAAASIAQVHRAHLANGGGAVAVKVLRPGIERAFRRDIDAFYFAAWAVSIIVPSSRRLRPIDVIRHFEGVVDGELDLRLETSAMSEFADTTAKDAGFAVPQPHWPLCSRRVMTLDWVEGVSLHDEAALQAAGHDRPALATRVLQLFLKHALRDGFFHADMHQGNLKVAANGDIVALDFGIMGRIDVYTRRVYAEILYGFISRDYRRVAEVHFEAGYVPADRDIDAFASALRVVGEPIFGMNANQISMARLLIYLFDVTERFGMETRTELILLQRTMVVVEGVARDLDPQINLWEVARPVVEEYIKQNIGPRVLSRELRKTARIVMRYAPQLPVLLEHSLRQMNHSLEQRHNPPRHYSRGWYVGFVLVLFALGVGVGVFLF